MLNGLLVFLALNVIIIVHEFGHFITAKLMGVKPKSFAVGFGKAIYSHTSKSGIVYRINWLPIGGYVDFDMDSLDKEAPFKKFWIIFNGVFFNFIFAILLCFCFVLMTHHPIVGGSTSDSWGFWQAISYTWQSVIGVTDMIFQSLLELFISPKMEYVAGPIQLIRDGSLIVSQSPLMFIPLVVMVDLNVMLFNMLPIPALDGGRLIFIILEILTRRRFKVEKYFHTVGLIILLALMVFILGKDIFVILTQPISMAP